jgi:hypothetical protein
MDRKPYPSDVAASKRRDQAVAGRHWKATVESPEKMSEHKTSYVAVPTHR